MKTEKSYLDGLIEKVERLNYRKISSQIKELITILSNPLLKDDYIKAIYKTFSSLNKEENDKKINLKKEKYSQISDKVLFLLTSNNFFNLPDNEKEIILFYLLTTPSPKEQNEILNALSFLFEDKENCQIKDPEVIDLEKKDFKMHFVLDVALEGLDQVKNYKLLLDFYIITKNYELKPELLYKTLNYFKNEKEWDALIKFYQDPDSQKIKPEIFNEVLENLNNIKDWNDLIDFYENPENQTVRPDILNDVLENLRKSSGWTILSLFYKNPENQKIRPELFYETLENLQKNRKWYSLIRFYKNPENQKIRPELFYETLENLKNDEDWHILLNFYENPENQKNRFDILEAAIKGLDSCEDDRYLLIFYEDPENHKVCPEILEKVLERLYREKNFNRLLDFYVNPENQTVRPDILKKTLRELKIAKNWFALINFYENPENQQVQPEIFYKTLKSLKRWKHWINLLKFYKNPKNQTIKPEFLQLALHNLKENRSWRNLLDFYEIPENQKIKPEIFEAALVEAILNKEWHILLDFSKKFLHQQELRKDFDKIKNKISNSLSSISDKNLAYRCLAQICNYLLQNNPFSLISLLPSKDLLYIIVGKNLGLDPFVIQSWNLSKKEQQSLLPVFVSLSEKGIKFDFPFPYHLRDEIKKSNKLNEMLIEYFKNLNFVSYLPQEINKNLIENHFKKIQEIISKYKVEQTTVNVSYLFLKEILLEVKSLKLETAKKIREFLNISLDISDEDIVNFIEKSSYTDIILTLAKNYSVFSYKAGLDLLSKITASLIKDRTLKDYFQMRYDLKDGVTNLQLQPLLKGKNPKEKIEILQKWRNPYYTFKILSEQEKEETQYTGISLDQIWNHIKSQTYDDKHYEELFLLEELKNLDQELKNKILNLFHIIFNSENKKIDFGLIKDSLRKQLSNEKTDVLIGYFQFLKDIVLKQKNLKDLLSSIERLNSKIKYDWQEFSQLIIWREDIYSYLKIFLEAEYENKKIKNKQIILFSYISDHPKTLLEIGKYPVPTCQSYESTASLNKYLLGYVFDAHIKALVLREIQIETEEKIDEISLNKSQIEFDEEKEFIKIIIPEKNIAIETKVSKPIARRIILLAKKFNRPAILVEPIYSKRGRGDNSLDKFLIEPLLKLKQELNLELVSSAKEVSLPISHNQLGFYLDV